MGKRLKIQHRIWSVGIVAALVLGTTGCTSDKEVVSEVTTSLINIYKTGETKNGFTQVAENEYLELLFEPTSTQICVRDKETNKKWYSNPQDIAEDTLANEKNKGKLKSQITIYASTPKGDVLEMNNYEFGTSLNQFQYELIENGVKVWYTIGKAEEVYCLPQVISAQRFEEMIVSKIENPDEKRSIEGAYKKLDLANTKEKKLQEKLLIQYPQLETEILYELRPKQQKFRLEQMSQIVQSTGYTMEDVEYDEEVNGIESKEDNVKFSVAVEYKIDGADFVANVPIEEVQYDAKYPITNIKLLEFFGAAGHKEEGYIFIPDATGALIYLNNGKKQAPTYNGKVYGLDYSIIQKEKSDTITQVHFPVFGMKNEQGAFIGIVEQAEALATIEADISGKVHLYNNVATNFNIIPNDKVDMTKRTGNTTIKAYQNRIIEEDLQIRYKFINEKNATYVDMANSYRTYLLESGKLEKKEIETTPFVVEYIGIIDVLEHIVGVPVRGMIPLTTYEQAREITQQLLNMGVKEISIKYSGMANKGVYHTLPTQIDLEKELGGKKQFTEFNQFIKDNNLTLYPEFDVQYINQNTFFDGYLKYQDGARMINKEMAEKIPFNYVTYLPDKTKNKAQIATHEFRGEVIKDLEKELGKYQINGISLSSMGKELNSDFNEKNIVDRQQAVEKTSRQLSQVKDKEIMVSGGNEYVLAYADIITNMPMTGNGFNIVDEEIPFMQIVLHGYIPYTGEALNLAQDYNNALLKSIEVGAGLQYTWFYEENYKIKDTDYSRLYSANYQNWIDEATRLYTQIEKDFGDICNQTIIAHEKLQEGVYQVTYEKGKSIIINYNPHIVTIGEIAVEAEDYAIVEGGKK